MPGNRYILLLLWTVISIPSLPQLPAFEERYAEEMLSRDENSMIPVEIFEERLELLQSPLDLNSANRERLIASGLFTPLQIRSLLNYRDQYGPLYSIYELRGMSGFTLSGIREIAPYLTAAPLQVLQGNPASPSHFVLTLERTLPASSGYGAGGKDGKDAVYAGHPLSSEFRLKATAGKNLSLGLTFEKDPGERFLRGHIPEHLAGFLSYSGSGIVEQLVIGCFRLHHGMGLVNGNGFMHAADHYRNRMNPDMLLKPFATASENRYGQGIACRLQINRTELLAWSSYRQIDLSLAGADSSAVNPDWAESQRLTGLHRTAGELAGSGLGYRIHAGVHSLLRFNRVSMGAIVGLDGSGLTRRGIDSLALTGGRFLQGIASMHGNWKGDRLELFGEMAFRSLESAAFLGGMNFHFNDFLQALLLVHSYDEDYRGILPSAYASGSRIGNERGMAIHLHVEPASLLTADLTAEIFSSPGPRSLAPVPTYGYRFIWTFSSPGGRDFAWRIRYVEKCWQTKPFDRSAGSRIELCWSHQPAANLSWQTRIISTWNNGGPDEGPGMAAAQQVKISLKKILNCTFQFVVFRVNEWDNRIYLHEPGLLYSFKFPVCYGKGQKITALVSLHTGRRFTLSSEASTILYFDREEIGSGYDRIQGNRKWTMGFQLRMRL